jgi:hypothetical protein
MTEVTTIQTVASRLRRMARNPNESSQVTTEHSSDSPQATAPKPKSKQDLVLDLLRRDGGALLTDLVEATGWLPHTARAALTGLKTKGHVIIGTKVDKTTRYSIAGE